MENKDSESNINQSTYSTALLGKVDTKAKMFEQLRIATFCSMLFGASLVTYASVWCIVFGTVITLCSYLMCLICHINLRLNQNLHNRIVRRRYKKNYYVDTKEY